MQLVDVISSDNQGMRTSISNAHYHELRTDMTRYSECSGTPPHKRSLLDVIRTWHMQAYDHGWKPGWQWLFLIPCKAGTCYKHPKRITGLSHSVNTCNVLAWYSTNVLSIRYAVHSKRDVPTNLRDMMDITPWCVPGRRLIFAAQPDCARGTVVQTTAHVENFAFLMDAITRDFTGIQTESSECPIGESSFRSYPAILIMTGVIEKVACFQRGLPSTTKI